MTPNTFTILSKPEDPSEGDQIQDILEEEANRLAQFMDKQSGGLPHRVGISISREIRRLRALAYWASRAKKGKPSLEDGL